MLIQILWHSSRVYICVTRFTDNCASIESSFFFYLQSYYNLIIKVVVLLIKYQYIITIIDFFVYKINLLRYVFVQIQKYTLVTYLYMLWASFYLISCFKTIKQQYSIKPQ